MRRRELARIVGVTVAAAAVLGVSGCGKKPDNRPAPDIISTKTPNPIEQSKERYTQALERAKQWQSNAELERVYRKYNGTLAPSSPVPLAYAFSSLADPKSTFEVVYRDEDVSEQTAKRLPFELLFEPIDVAQWKVAPDDALRAAEAAGGQAFREKHLAGYTLLQQLSKVGVHPLQWFFQYDAGDGTKARLEIYVNADNKAIDSKQASKRS